MRYAILGANGQLGQVFSRLLGNRAIPLARDQADLTEPETLRATLTSVRPDVVLNCAAYNLVDKAESDPAPAFAVNAWGVGALARICRDLDSIFVHYSTNYVFGLDRECRTPYAESALPGPISAYAASKLAGECLARAGCAKHFVVRTCGLFGVTRPAGGKRSFVELMLHLAKEGKPIRVVNDQVCAPTRTDDLATATLALLGTGAYGLYHLTSAGACSWFEFARAIFEIAEVKADLTGVSSVEFGAPAARPAYSVLANHSYAQLGFRPLPDWRDALAAYLAERQEPRTQ